MPNPQVTVHMIVKNEDIYIWYAIMSVIEHTDKILIYDTGSTDKTVDIIKSIKSKKIKFEQKRPVTAEELTLLRQEQLNETKTQWVWVVDGDEIYTKQTALEVRELMNKNIYKGGVVRRYDLLGDIYHYQSENIGEYNLFGQKGHLVLRLLNIEKFPGLNLQGVYPYEGYYDATGTALIDYSGKEFFITKGKIFHAMYLKRSTMGKNLLHTLHRNKYKIETGNLFSATTLFPEVFFADHPSIVPSVLATRDARYDLLASIITPIKKVKRKLVK